jgi:Obg family GTPase CgtA-like protein
LQERKLPQDTTVIKNSDGEYVVVSEYVDYWANRIPLTTPDNIIRFNQKLQTSQAEEKAKQLGAKRGDTLVVAGTKFTID